MTRQVVRDWVIKFNADGPDGLIWILGISGLIPSVKKRDDFTKPNACDPYLFRLH